MIYPCSNFAAIDLGLVSSNRDVVEIKVPKYKVRFDIEEMISLPSVELFCKETHEKIVYFVSGTLTSASGAVSGLAEE